jgi:3-oxoacyl-[acyl-carrier protein] reductase
VKQPIDSLMLSNAVRSSVTAWSKTLSDEVAREGITVNTIAPGRIETERLIEIDTFMAERTGASPEQVRSAKVAAIPAGRYGRPEEFAAAAVFLASDKASYITGVTLLVDGGAFRGTY